MQSYINFISGFLWMCWGPWNEKGTWLIDTASICLQVFCLLKKKKKTDVEIRLNFYLQILARDGEQNDKEKWINLIGDVAGCVSIKRPKEVMWDNSDIVHFVQHLFCFLFFWVVSAWEWQLLNVKVVVNGQELYLSSNLCSPSCARNSCHVKSCLAWKIMLTWPYELYINNSCKAQIERK